MAVSLSPERSTTGGRYAGRVAVIDIGSNSIRLVVFDSAGRVPVPLFNERVICGLGKGLGTSGLLNEEGVALAVTNLLRFARLSEAMGVSRLDMLATAAVRDASNGRAFVSQIEQSCGYPVSILSGEEEARLSALGVLAGMPEADGFMGDLGGGSLEIVELKDSGLRRAVTLPLGPLRLIDASGDDRGKARQDIARQLAAVTWLKELRGRSFYAVGGAWRALARVHMEQAGYPLHVIHGYRLERGEALDLSEVIAQQGRRSIARIAGVSRRRVEALPYAALLLGGLIEAGGPKEIIFSSFGLREGLLFDRLPLTERRRDPLLMAASDFAQREGRFPDLGEDLRKWVAPLFAEEKAEVLRLVEAACHLSDIGWREHPDYRAQQTMARVLYHPFIALDHVGRGFIALSIFARYGGNDETLARPAVALLPHRLAGKARVLGLALRLAYALSGGTDALLKRTKLKFEEGRLRLKLPGDGAIPPGEAIERRLQALADALGAKESQLSMARKP